MKYPCFPEMSWKGYFQADTLLASFYLETHFLYIHFNSLEKGQERVNKAAAEVTIHTSIPGPD